MTEPRSLSDADLLAWAVVLEYRRRQTHEGLKVLLLTFPPCPTCGGQVTEAKTWWIQDPIRYDGVISVEPCGHSHTATATDMERIHDHATEMLDHLRRDDRLPGGKTWGADDVLREARARIGKPGEAAAEATEQDTCQGEIGIVRRQGELSDQMGVLQNRLRLAHKARRAKEHQLDGIRRALCDAGFMEEDDPYSHADLEDVIRQAGEAGPEENRRLRERLRLLTDEKVADIVGPNIELLCAEIKRLKAEVAAARKFAGEMRDFCSPHAVAADYADRLIEAMDRAKEGS